MKVYLGTDHAGFYLKEKIKASLLRLGYEVIDEGAFIYDKQDDYPDFIAKAARSVSEDPEDSRGIVIGGSGEAEMMTANKFKHVRCALFYTPAIPVEAADVAGRKSEDPFEIIRLTREHNNANMLSLSARFLKEEEAVEAVERWLKEPFPGDGRHKRRIEKIKRIEEENFE